MLPEILLIPCCGIRPTNQPAPEDTLLRLFHGLCLWNTGLYHGILVTGGTFNPRSVQTKPGGQIMKDWLVERDVPDECILAENCSLDTFENVKLGLATLQHNKWFPANITVVTQWQHALRLQATFLLGYNLFIKTVPLRYSVSTRTALNEYLFMAYHLFDPTGKRHLAVRHRELRRLESYSC